MVEATAEEEAISSLPSSVVVYGFRLIRVECECDSGCSSCGVVDGRGIGSVAPLSSIILVDDDEDDDDDAEAAVAITGGAGVGLMEEEEEDEDDDSGCANDVVRVPAVRVVVVVVAVGRTATVLIGSGNARGSSLSFRYNRSSSIAAVHHTRTDRNTRKSRGCTPLNCEVSANKPNAINADRSSE